jgi:uncharacterized protein with NRDE domain
MCTIAFAYGVFDGFAVASNRDESYGRGFVPPKVRRTEKGGGWRFAPQDERAGGTWIGFNDEGVFVTLSNLPVPRDDARSRGALCDELLAASSVAEARRLLRESYESHVYEGFNVVVGSSDTCFVGVNDGSLRIIEPNEGVHVVTNTPFDDSGKKARRVEEAVPPAEGDAIGWLQEVRPVFADHNLGVCVHEDERGTTSSNLIYVAPEPRNSLWQFADGAPCTSTYERVFPPAEDF